MATLLVTVGPVGRRRIEVWTADGQRLGSISAYGPAAARSGGTYTLPVPAAALSDGHLALRFTVTDGNAAWPAVAGEVLDVRLALPDG